MKIAYCGYDFFHTCLRGLIEDGHEIVRIFSFPCDGRFNYNAYIKQIAASRSIPVSEEPVNAQIVQALQEQGVELLITAGYQYKIPDLDQSGIRGINIHPTLLPDGRGVWPLPWVILKNYQRSGVTIHKLSGRWDAGDILLQQEYPVSDNELLESLSCKTQMLAATMLKHVLQNFDNLWNQAQPQQEQNSSYWPMPGSKERYIDWNMSVEQIDRIVRAFGKFSALASFDDTAWNIYDVAVWPETHNEMPGSKVHVTNTETVIAASDGYVCLRYFEKSES
jgi:methionyl-tRNA formyltransferase